MKRLALLLAFVLGLPALAAVETTTINGTVRDVSGALVTAGKVTVTLSIPGTTPDGAGTSVVASPVSAAIGPSGTFTVVVVPNDAITPSGTYYSFRFSETAPGSMTWTEKRIVATSPDPATLADTTLVDTPPGITPPIAHVQDEGAALSQRTALNFTGAGVTCSDNPASSRTDCTIPGGGSASGDLSGTYPAPTIKSSVALTGTPTAPTAAVGTNSTQIATTAFCMALDSPVFSTTMTLPLASSEGTCTSAQRGHFKIVQGTTGIEDCIEACLKNASDTYNWTIVACGGL